MNLKHLWSIIRGRRTNYRFAGISMTYYPEGDPMSRMSEMSQAMLDAEDERILKMTRPELETELAKTGETFDGAVMRADAAIKRGVAEAEMRLAIKVWLKCPADKRPSPAALGQRIADIATALPRS